MHAQVDSGRRAQAGPARDAGARASERRASREDLDSALLQVMADEARLAQAALQAAESVRAAGALPSLPCPL